MAGDFCVLVLRGAISPARGGNDSFDLPCGHMVSPSGEVWDACAARSKAGPVMGLRPLRGPPCIPPEAPPKRGVQLPWRDEGTRLVLRELPSLPALAQVISLRDA